MPKSTSTSAKRMDSQWAADEGAWTRYLGTGIWRVAEDWGRYRWAPWDEMPSETPRVVPYGHAQICLF